MSFDIKHTVNTLANKINGTVRYYADTPESIFVDLPRTNFNFVFFNAVKDGIIDPKQELFKVDGSLLKDIGWRRKHPFTLSIQEHVFNTIQIWVDTDYNEQDMLETETLVNHLNLCIGMFSSGINLPNKVSIKSITTDFHQLKYYSDNAKYTSVSISELASPSTDKYLYFAVKCKRGILNTQTKEFIEYSLVKEKVLDVDYIYEDDSEYVIVKIPQDDYAGKTYCSLGYWLYSLLYGLTYNEDTAEVKQLKEFTDAVATRKNFRIREGYIEETIEHLKSSIDSTWLSLRMNKLL